MKILLSKGISWELDPNNSYDYLTQREIIDFCGCLPKAITKNDVELIHDDLIKIVKQRYGAGLKGCRVGQMVDSRVLKLQNDDELHPLMTAKLDGDVNHLINLFPYGLLNICSRQKNTQINSLLLAYN